MRVFKQGDSKWSSLKINGTSRTIGAVGCVITALAQALVHLGVNPAATPAGVLQHLELAGLFLPGQAAVDAGKAALSLGMQASFKEVGNYSQIRAALQRALADDGVALVCVDHTGDDIGDHYILAIRADATGIECLDPAIGAVIYLDAAHLETSVQWGTRRKHYAVTSVRSLRRKDPNGDS